MYFLLKYKFMIFIKYVLFKNITFHINVFSINLLHKGNKHPSVISFLNQFIPNHPFTVA